VFVDFEAYLLTEAGVMPSTYKVTMRRLRHAEAHGLNVRRVRRRRGMAVDVIQSYLGHARINTTMRYLQTDPWRIEDELEGMDRSAPWTRSGTASASPLVQEGS
jgi:integrase